MEGACPHRSGAAHRPFRSGSLQYAEDSEPIGIDLPYNPFPLIRDPVVLEKFWVVIPPHISPPSSSFYPVRLSADSTAVSNADSSRLPAPLAQMLRDHPDLLRGVVSIRATTVLGGKEYISLGSGYCFKRYCLTAKHVVDVKTDGGDTLQIANIQVAPLLTQQKVQWTTVTRTQNRGLLAHMPGCLGNPKLCDFIVLHVPDSAPVFRSAPLRIASTPHPDTSVALIGRPANLQAEHLAAEQADGSIGKEWTLDGMKRVFQQEHIDSKTGLTNPLTPPIVTFATKCGAELGRGVGLPLCFAALPSTVGMNGGPLFDPSGRFLGLLVGNAEAAAGSLFVTPLLHKDLRYVVQTFFGGRKK